MGESKISKVQIFPARVAVLLSCFSLLCLFAGCFNISCIAGSSPEVVIYTSVDQVFSEPVFNNFQQQTGIRVLPVYDVEAAKTTGLVNRIIAEKNRPLADVFWNGEFVQTLLLQEQGLLESYESVNAGEIPSQYRDPGNYWTGICGRARVLLINTGMLSKENYPRSISDFLNTTYPARKIGIANPSFGSNASHAAAIYSLTGLEKGRAFYRSIRDRGVSIIEGNAMVKDMVVSGQLLFGLMDTDDAEGALRDKAGVSIIFPDQDSTGTLVLPNTICLIKSAPHPATARKLIDYLLSKDVEKALTEAGWSHIPLRSVGAKLQYIDATNIKSMKISLQDIYSNLKYVQKDMPEIFMR